MNRRLIFIVVGVIAIVAIVSWGSHFALIRARAKREASRRSISANNLKMISLGLLHFESRNGAFPAPSSVDAEGRPLLSWRVHLLPFVDEQALYDEFRLDEPWDSSHNQRLIERMPATFCYPGNDPAKGMTNYVLPRGKETMYAASDTTPSYRGLDRNTIMLLEVSDSNAVIWTKGDDYEVESIAPLKEVVGLREGEFLAAMADGSVHRLRGDIGREEIIALFTPHGREQVVLENLYPASR